MKEQYERTELSITTFGLEDVIITSGVIDRLFTRNRYEEHIIDER